MKIVVLSHCAAQGGAEKIATLLANYLVNKGFDVYFFAVHFDEIQYHLDDRLHYEYSGIDSGNKSLKQIRRILSVRKFVKKVQPEAVISLVNIESVGLIGLRNTKIICSLRNDPARYYNKGIKRVLRHIAYLEADKMVFQTKQAMNYFPQSIRKKGKIIVNPVQCDLPYWNPKQDDKYVMTACRLNEQKNIPLMIEAFDLFRLDYPGYKLKIFGDGPERIKIEEIISALDLQDEVLLMGQSSNIPEELMGASLFLLSSNYEGISNAMLEALAVGVPCICTNCPVGGAEMFIQNGINGYLSEPMDVKSFTENMKTGMEIFEVTKMHGEANKIREKLSEDTIFSDWEKIVNSLTRR